MEKKRNSKDNFIAGILHFVIILYGISAAFLYYKQTQWTGGAVYESDLPVHIKMIIEDGWYYSLTAFVYKALYMLGDGALAIAVFLAVCTVAAVYLTYELLLVICKKNGLSDGLKNNATGDNCIAVPYLRNLFLLVAIILNIVMPCYIRGLSDGRYIGMESANIWHNSTYIVMKPVALICMILYVDLMESYKKELTLKKWLGFAVSLAVCTGVKPSFLVVFAPMMAVFLLVDLVKHVPFKKIFIFGLAVIPSLAIVLFQNAVLFGSDTGNGWEMKPGYALGLHSGHPIIVAGLSILFPLIVLVWNIKRLKTDRWFSSAWMMAIIGFLEVFLLCETGGRADDGNFMWGYSFAILIIFITSMLMWGCNLRESKALGYFSKENTSEHMSGKLKRKNLIYKAYVCVTTVVLIYHIYCGVYFYTNLLRGVSYYMWD